MGREDCTSYIEIDGEIYCGYYDVGFVKCDDVEHCPEGLDELDEDEDELYWDEVEERD